MSEAFERGVVALRQGLREGLLYEQLSLWYLKLTGNMRKKASESVKAEREQVLHSLSARSARGLCPSRVLLPAWTRHLSACAGTSDHPLHSRTDSHAGTDAHVQSLTVWTVQWNWQIAAAAARRSTRIATDLATKQVSFMIYRNTLRVEAKGRKSR